MNFLENIGEKNIPADEEDEDEAGPKNFAKGWGSRTHAPNYAGVEEEEEAPVEPLEPALAAIVAPEPAPVSKPEIVLTASAVATPPPAAIIEPIVASAPESASTPTPVPLSTFIGTFKSTNEPYVILEISLADGQPKVVLIDEDGVRMDAANVGISGNELSYDIDMEGLNRFTITRQGGMITGRWTDSAGDNGTAEYAICTETTNVTAPSPTPEPTPVTAVDPETPSTGLGPGHHRLGRVRLCVRLGHAVVA